MAAHSETRSDLFGALFDQVQRRGLFADSKAFADAVPLTNPAEILGAYASLDAPDDDTLR